MKAGLVLAAVAAVCMSTIAAGQMGPGMGHPGMGHEMKADQCPGPGAMGGPGMCPKMKGGHEGCGMGPGMVGGQGRGHGMMGSQGQGHGMMGGPGPEALEKLGLGDEQRGKVREIHRDLQRKNHALMGSMRDLRWQSEDAAKAAEFDETAARKRFDAGAAIRKQMFEARLEARKQVDAVLTKEQREKLRQGPKHGPAGPGAHH